MIPDDRTWTRREILKTTAAGTLASSLGTFVVPAQETVPADPDRIRRENEHPGTRDWMTTNARIDPKTKYRSPWIEGYASKTSVRPGQSITFHVSTNPASPFLIEIYRLGYYQGHGGRLMHKIGPIPGAVQPDPPVGPKRLRECTWDPAASLVIPADWTSGVYLGKLTAERERLQSYVIFVVRDDRKADLLFQVSDTTWNAYNRWPSQFSLYDDGKKIWYWGPNVETSFDRPYGKYCQILDAPLSVGSGEFLLWEFPLAFWMEQHGYDLTYVSNLDTHFDPAGLSRAKGWLSVGHDEYWSLAMFDQMLKKVVDGLNLAFLSGNSICGVIDVRPSHDGRPGRIIERVGRFGSPQKEELENGFPEEALFTKNGPSEANLMGARSTYPVTGGGDWTCKMPGHWLFEGTGMKEGDGIPGLVGWEWHGDPAPIPGLEVVASGKIHSPRAEGTFTATVYPGPKKNFVFNAATIWWADGLAEPPGYLRPAVYTKPQGPDPRLQRITANLLKRMCEVQVKFYTIGYGGRAPAEFTSLLVQHDVRSVADVRIHPQRASMGSYVKAGAADKGIEKLLSECGIAYRSILELGNLFRDLDDWRPSYRALFERTGELLVGRLTELPEPFCLLCAEKRVSECHRLVIAEYLVATRGWTVQHIE